MAANPAVSTAAAKFVSIEEYLRTSYRPDVEYIDGSSGKAWGDVGAWQAAVFAQLVV